MLKKDGLVYKLYNTEQESPNFELVDLLLPEAHLTNLTKDKRFQYLKYKFLEGSHRIANVSQFAKLLKDDP